MQFKFTVVIRTLNMTMWTQSTKMADKNKPVKKMTRHLVSPTGWLTQSGYEVQIIADLGSKFDL